MRLGMFNLKTVSIMQDAKIWQKAIYNMFKSDSILGSFIQLHTKKIFVIQFSAVKI